MNFDQKTVLITGANRGIGKHTVESLLKRNVSKVYAAARNPAQLPDFGDDRVIPLALDITNAGQVLKATEIASDTDILINNAGVAAFTSLLDGPTELLNRDMQTNYFGTLEMVRQFVPVLEGKPGAAIVNVVTIAAFSNFPIFGGYSASKSALFSLSQGIRIELATRGISVHTVNPGPNETNLVAEFPGDKCDPVITAENALLALEKGEADIFPDEASQKMIAIWKRDYRDLEAMVNQMHNAA